MNCRNDLLHFRAARWPRLECAIAACPIQVGVHHRLSPLSCANVGMLLSKNSVEDERENLGLRRPDHDLGRPQLPSPKRAWSAKEVFLVVSLALNIVLIASCSRGPGLGSDSDLRGTVGPGSLPPAWTLTPEPFRTVRALVTERTTPEPSRTSGTITGPIYTPSSGTYPMSLWSSFIGRHDIGDNF